MLTKLAVISVLLSLTLVASLPHTTESDPLTPEDLEEGVKETREEMESLKQQLDGLIGKAIMGDKSEQDWADLMADMAEHIKDSHDMFFNAMSKVFHLGMKMFSAEHGFEQVTRCKNLVLSTQDPEFGKDEFLPMVELALAKDLLCFSNLLDETVVMKVRRPGQTPSENQVVKFMADSILDLFKMKNDGERFLWAVHHVTSTYTSLAPNLHKHFTDKLSEREQVVRQLIKALSLKH